MTMRRWSGDRCRPLSALLLSRPGFRWSNSLSPNRSRGSSSSSGASPSSTTSHLPSRTSGILCLFRRVTSYSMSQRLSPSRGFWSTFSNPLRGSSSRWYRSQRARVDCVPEVDSVLASAGDS